MTQAFASVTCLHEPSTSQVPVVQASPSSGQLTTPPPHTPAPLQVVLAVQAFPSSHVVPIPTGDQSVVDTSGSHFKQELAASIVPAPTHDEAMKHSQPVATCSVTRSPTTSVKLSPVA